MYNYAQLNELGVVVALSRLGEGVVESEKLIKLTPENQPVMGDMYDGQKFIKPEAQQ